MEFPISSFPLILALLFLFLVALIRSTAIKRSQGRAKLPPSPWRLPIIGNMHHLKRPGFLHQTLRDLAAKHGPIIHLKLGQADTIVITSAEAAKEVLTTHDTNFASRPKRLFTSIVSYGNQDIMAAPYGPHWRQLRKICTLELLSLTRVKSLRAVREQEVCNLVEQISVSCGSPVNLSSKVASLSSRIFRWSTVGKECSHGERLASMVMEATGLATTMCVSDFFPSLSSVAFALSPTKARLERIHRQIDELLDQIIEEHREQVHGSSQDDLVDALLRRKDRGDADPQETPLTMTSIKGVLFDMALAGTQPVTTTLEWAMCELIRHPEVMKKVQSEVREAAKGRRNVEEGDLEEMHIMKLVIKETLRLHLPAPLMAPKLCAETCEIGGYLIPGGSRVVINSWAIARDPRYWDDPESFRPERFEGSSCCSSVNFVGSSFEYMPFGAGRRICPGIGFGMACVELVLAQLLFHFDWVLPDGMRPDELDMSEAILNTASIRKSELSLVATPRHLP